MSSTPMESFQEFLPEWEELLSVSPVKSLYLTPQWQQVWWDNFGDGRKMAGFYVRDAGSLMAVASLSRQGGEVTFTGSPDTFDYNDFLVRPGYETAFFDKLLRSLETDRVKTMTLYSLMENSPTLTHLPEQARQQGFRVEIIEEDVAPGLELPSSWDDYLARLSKKDRHELRRKLRRLELVESWRWYCIDDENGVASRLDEFLRLMRISDRDKDEYMTVERERFFRAMARLTTSLGLLKLFFLEIDGQPVATTLCFDYGTSRMLYNSGYNPDYAYYSVGLLLNVLCLRNAIEQGKGYFDFLRGSEPYKYHLGGKDHILYQMVVTKS